MLLRPAATRSPLRMQRYLRMEGLRRLTPPPMKSSKGRTRQTRAEQIAEANAIFEWLRFDRLLAGDLALKTTKRVKSQEEVVLLLIDLLNIAEALALPDHKQFQQMWEHYQHHFLSNRNKASFFRRLREVTRRIAAARLDPSGTLHQFVTNNFENEGWDNSLLPREVEVPVVRIATLHPGVLEDFLPKFFLQSSDLAPPGFNSALRSTFERATLILLFVQHFGWSAEKHTRNLIALNAIKPSKVETVKKFIRDLRARHRRHLEETKDARKRIAKRKGTSDPEKRPCSSPRPN